MCERIRRFARKKKISRLIFRRKRRQRTWVNANVPSRSTGATWESEIKRLSAIFRKYPEVYFGSVMLQVQNSNARMVNSEGSAVVTPSTSTRLMMEAQTRAADGMELLRVETFQAPTAKGLPAESEAMRENRQNGGGFESTARGSGCGTV